MEKQLGYLPAFGRSMPLTARVSPNATVRFCDEEGTIPGGVKALAAPASAMARRVEVYIANACSNDCPDLTR